MTLHRYLRIALSLAFVCLLFWASNGLLYLFNHPKYKGEATAALLALVLLLIIFLGSAVSMARWCFASSHKPAELSQGER